MRQRWSLCLLTLVLAGNACSGGASSGGAPGVAAAPSPDRSDSRNRDIILAAEIAQSGVGVTNAYDLVQRLRPNYLRPVGRTSMRNTVASTPLVRLDGQELGETSSLRSVEIGLVHEVRYYSIVEAETKFGGDRGRAVIAISTKKMTR